MTPTIKHVISISNGLRKKGAKMIPLQGTFGHFHKNWRRSIRGVEYVCLDELEVFKI